MGRRKLSREFQEESVRLLARSGKPLKVVAKELGVSAASLSTWRKRMLSDGSVKRSVLTESERDELARLRSEVTVLKKENQFLKRAAAFFAHASD